MARIARSHESGRASVSFHRDCELLSMRRELDRHEREEPK